MHYNTLNQSQSCIGLENSGFRITGFGNHPIYNHVVWNVGVVRVRVGMSTLRESTANDTAAFAAA